jgi:adenylosuccinate lyase
MEPKATSPDVLCERYASRAMAAIWSQRAKVVLERELWIAVMRAQRALGIDVPEQAISDYERVKGDVDLTRILERERVTRHDVKARIDEFCALAGHEHIHKGLTSRDLTENVEQLQILRGLRLLRTKSAAALVRLADRVAEHRSLALTARTHNVPAQLTTVGKRLAMFGAEMLAAHAALEALLQAYPLRGLKGAVGTQLDLLTLLNGDAAKVRELELRIARELGFAEVLFAVGQVYPRDWDFEVLSVLYRLGSGPSSFAKTMRLMTGEELFSEGFAAGQVGSSAMPHKLNPRSCERINGLHVVLRGFLTMAASIAGDQWNEGDVSCSVVRRVALPGSMFAIDGLLETFLTSAGEMEFFPGKIAAENRRWLPFLATTTILMESVKRGRGREAAHGAIKEHAVAATREGRSGGEEPVDLLSRIAADDRVGLDRAQLDRILGDDVRFVGAALAQADEFIARVEAVRQNVPEAVETVPEPLL